MGRIKERFQPVSAIFIIKGRNGSVLAVPDFIRVARKKQPPQRVLQDHAVRKNCDALPVVPQGNLVQRLQKAPREFLIAFGAFDRPLLRHLGKFPVNLRLLAHDLSEGCVLPDAHMYLAEARLCVQRQSLRLPDRARSGAGADEVAGVDRVDRHRFKAFLQRCDLAQAVGRDRGIVPSMHAPEDISLRLCMADEIKRCHKITTYFPISFFIFRAASTAQAV